MSDASITRVRLQRLPAPGATPGGSFAHATAPVARDRIAELKRTGRQVVLDLRGLRFIDSTGLNLVLRLAAESTRDGWELSLIPGSSAVQRVFKLTGTEGRLPFRSPPTDGKHRVE